MAEEDQQKQIDELRAIVTDMFTRGLAESDPGVQKMIADGLAARRILISIQIAFSSSGPLAISFGVTDSRGENRMALFDVIDPSGKRFVLQQLPQMATTHDA